MTEWIGHTQDEKEFLRHTKRKQQHERGEISSKDNNDDADIKKQKMILQQHSMDMCKIIMTQQRNIVAIHFMQSNEGIEIKQYKFQELDPQRTHDTFMRV